jgi:hypothetical protein
MNSIQWHGRVCFVKRTTMMLTTPGGKPASCAKRPRYSADSGVSDATCAPMFSGQVIG